MQSRKRGQLVPQTPGEHRSMCPGCGEVGRRLADRLDCTAGLLVTPVRGPKFPEKVGGKKGVVHTLLAVFFAAKWYFCVAENLCRLT